MTYDTLVLFPEEFCTRMSDFDHSNELTRESKDRLAAMGIDTRFYCSLGKGCLLHCMSEDLLALTLAFEGIEDQGFR